MLQMDFKRAADLSADQDMGQVMNFALLDTACRCPGYFEEQCLAEAAQGCFWDYDGQQQTGKWCQCGEPQPVDPNAQAPVATCPAGWEQQGVAGADIGGCGLQSCSERYGLTSEAACAASCDANSQCASFSYAPMNGDRNHPGVTACTLYDSATPTGTWTGTQGIATQVMCARADAANTQPFFTGFWNGNRNNWNGDVGYDFRANDDISVTHLGRALFNGALREFAMVSLWSTQTQALLATVSVGPSSHVDGNYAYETLPSPVQLQSGQEYRITQQCHNGMPDSWYDASEFALSQANSVATFIGGVYRSGNGYPLNNDGSYRRPGMLNLLFESGAAPAPAPAPAPVPAPAPAPAPAPVPWDNIRLNGGTDTRGRLEVLHDGQWGTVCDDGFDMNDARVACLQLGFTSAVAQIQSFGGGSGPIWLDDMGCNGAESMIHDCPNRGAFGSHNCVHSEDVGIECA
jgi:serine protease 12 (motopsin)